MIKNSKAIKAAKLLKQTCNVIPEKYTIYNGAFLFQAYPPGFKNKERCMSPWYLVDLKSKAAGPFSPAFDLDGFFKATENLKNL